MTTISNRMLLDTGHAPPSKPSKLPDSASERPHVQPSGKPDGHQYTPTPQEYARRTDQALRHYSEALATGSQEEIAAAKTELFHAVAGEIGNKIDQSISGASNVPIYASLQRVAAYGNAIMERHADDPLARQMIEAAITKYRVQVAATTGADVAATTIDAVDAAGGSAGRKLRAVGEAMEDQPAQIIQSILRDDRVIEWTHLVADAVDKSNMASFPMGYAGNADASKQVLQELQGAIEGLPPELARIVIGQSLNTFRTLGQLDATYDSHEVGDMLAGIGTMLRPLSADAAGQSVTADVARAFLEGFFEANPGALLAPRDEGVDRVNALATNLSFTKALAQAASDLNHIDAADNILAQAAIDVREVLKYEISAEFTQAHEATASAEQHLGELLVRSEPLTDAQKQDFIEAYRGRSDVAALYRREADAAASFAAYMHENQDLLLFAAERDPGFIGPLGDWMSGALEAGQGDLVVELTEEILDAPQVLAMFDAERPGLIDSLYRDAIVTKGAELFLESDGDTTSCMDDFAAWVEMRQKGSGGIQGIKLAIEEMGKIAPGNLVSAEHLGASLKAMDGRLGKIWAGGLAGVAVIASAYNGLNSKEMDLAVSSLAAAGATGTEFTAKAAQYLSRAGKFKIAETAAAEVGAVAARMVRPLGAISNMAMFAHDLDKLAETSDPAYAVAVLGDTLGLIGALTMSTPVGMVLFGGGALMSLIGGWFGAKGEERRTAEIFRNEQRDLLGQIGLDPALVSAIQDSDPVMLANFQKMGLDSSQVQDLARAYPELITNRSGLEPFLSQSLDDKSFLAFQEATGLDGDRLYHMLQAADSAVPGEGIMWVISVICNRGGVGGIYDYDPSHPNSDVVNARSPGELVDKLRARAEEALDADEPEAASAMEAAASWLAAN